MILKNIVANNNNSYSQNKILENSLNNQKGRTPGSQVNESIGSELEKMFSAFKENIVQLLEKNE